MSDAQFAVTAAEMSAFHQALSPAPNCLLHGTESEGTVEMTTMIGQVKLSYSFDGAALSVRILGKPAFWPAEQIVQHITRAIDAARKTLL
jgi:hypothetical protein